jgi:alpha-tubulin suppressor-like RCC1 family protein
MQFAKSLNDKAHRRTDHAMRGLSAPAVLALLVAAVHAEAELGSKPAQASPPEASRRAGEIQRIAPGEYQCFFLVGGDVFGIGSNRCGQLGIGIGAPYPPLPPVAIHAPLRTKFIDVAAGGYHSLAVDTTGHVWTWGSNRYGQRGDGSPLERDGVPAPLENGLPARIAQDSQGHDFDNVIRVCSGWWINGALKNDGTVWVWGRNSEETSGLAGNEKITSAALDRPTQVPFEPGVSIVDLATNGALWMARDANGRVWSWGGGAESFENRGSGQRDFAKPCLLPNLPKIQAIAVGEGFSYALDTEGNLWGWGVSGTYLGLGPAQGGWFPQPTPVKLSFPEFGGVKVSAVAVSGHSTHVILADGTLWGWGDSALGEVGNGEMLDFQRWNYSWDWGKFERMVFRPVRIAPEVNNFGALYSTAMCFYAYAVTQDDQVYSWGRNKTGVLGNGVIPTGNVAEHPDSWNVPTATRVSPLSTQGIREVPSKP